MAPEWSGAGTFASGVLTATVAMEIPFTYRIACAGAITTAEKYSTFAWNSPAVRKPTVLFTCPGFFRRPRFFKPPRGDRGAARLVRGAP